MTKVLLENVSAELFFDFYKDRERGEREIEFIDGPIGVTLEADTSEMEQDIEDADEDAALEKLLASEGYDQPSIRICNDLESVKGIITEHQAPNGKNFTVGELLAAVHAHEVQTRGKAEWFGKVDDHHVYFEGLHEEPDGTFRISWGS